MDGSLVGSEPMHDADVAVLVREAQAGRSSAFAALIQRYSGRLFHFLLSMGLARHDAEDLVQDTLLKAYQNLDRYDAQYSFSTWLFTIGRRQAINHLRDQKKSKPMLMARPVLAGHTDERTYAAEECDCVWQSAAQILNEHQYSVLWLRYGEDLSIRQIAVQTGLSEQNARVILHRARARLADELKDQS